MGTEKTGECLFFGRLDLLCFLYLLSFLFVCCVHYVFVVFIMFWFVCDWFMYLLCFSLGCCAFFVCCMFFCEFYVYFYVLLCPLTQ